MNAAITYARYGGPDVLSLSRAEIPRPGPGQVRIRVRAVAVNPIDAKIRSGRMDGVFPIRFPVLPGWAACARASATRRAGPPDSPSPPRPTPTRTAPRRSPS